MPCSPRLLLSSALAGLMAAALVAPDAHAQGPQLPGKDRGSAKRVDDKPALYPEATRTSPKPKVSAKMAKQLRELQELYQKDDKAGVLAKADEIAASSAAGAYEKAYAFQIAGNAAADLDDQARAMDYFRRAVEADALDNDAHFATMFNLAVIQASEDRNAEALATVDRFLAETRSAKPEQAAFRAGLLANLERYDEAATAFKALVAANPDDKRLLMNAAASLQSADKDAEATAMLEQAYTRGMLTDRRELRALYVSYLNGDRYKDAIKVIEDGQAKGVLQASPELAADLMVVANTAYFAEDEATAVALYTKAGPMAADGEAWLNLAKVLSNQGKHADAKAAAQKALDKGLKQPEDARRILSSR